MPNKVYKRCPVCRCNVELNGIGAKSSPKQTWLIQKTLPYSCRAFNKPSQSHDMNYHIDGVSKEFADAQFLNDMLLVADKKPFYNRWWFRHQARVFYSAVCVFGADAYHEAKIKCIENQSCLCLDGLECPVHPSVSPR